MPSNQDARLFFKVGDRVRMSEEGMNVLRYDAARLKGTVIGFCHDKECIRVRKDGKKHAGTYHFTFWRKIAPEATPKPIGGTRDAARI